MDQTERPTPIRVKVIMPFGGDDEERRRRAALDFKVIQAMADKYAADHQLEIDTAVCRKFSGEIGDPILEEIASAEVVVAILENNVNVTYELAFRHVLRGQMIVVLAEHGERPKYIDDWAYIEFGKEMKEKIAKQAADTENFPDISFDKGDISPGIKGAIERSLKTYNEFSQAMDQVLALEPAPSRFFADVVLKLQHGHVAKDRESSEEFGLGDGRKPPITH